MPTMGTHMNNGFIELRYFLKTPPMTLASMGSPTAVSVPDFTVYQQAHEQRLGDLSCALKNFVGPRCNPAFPYASSTRLFCASLLGRVISDVCPS